VLVFEMTAAQPDLDSHRLAVMELLLFFFLICVRPFFWAILSLPQPFLNPLGAFSSSKSACAQIRRQLSPASFLGVFFSR